MHNRTFVDDLKEINPVALVLFLLVLFMGKRSLKKYKERVNAPVSPTWFWG